MAALHCDGMSKETPTNDKSSAEGVQASPAPEQEGKARWSKPVRRPGQIWPIYKNYAEEFFRDPRNSKTTGGKISQLQLEPEEVWLNDIHVVHATLREDGSVRRLSIRRLDWAAATDWREKQEIKNHICGPDIEAVELFPADSRVVDTQNWFHLWVLPPGESFSFGFKDGRKSDERHYDVQRPFERREGEA
jgi:hypothetical protein